jgi:hypothetical protein
VARQIQAAEQRISESPSRVLLVDAQHELMQRVKADDAGAEAFATTARPQL